MFVVGLFLSNALKVRVTAGAQRRLMRERENPDVDLTDLVPLEPSRMGLLLPLSIFLVLVGAGMIVRYTGSDDVSAAALTIQGLVPVAAVVAEFYLYNPMERREPQPTWVDRWLARRQARWERRLESVQDQEGPRQSPSDDDVRGRARRPRHRATRSRRPVARPMAMRSPKLRAGGTAPRSGRSVLDIYKNDRLLRRAVKQSYVQNGKLKSRTDVYDWDRRLSSLRTKAFKKGLDNPKFKARPGYRPYKHSAFGDLREGRQKLPKAMHGPDARRAPLAAVRRALRRGTPTGTDKRYFR